MNKYIVKTVRLLGSLSAFRGRSKERRRAIRQKFVVRSLDRIEGLTYRVVKLVAHVVAFTGSSKKERRDIRQKVFEYFMGYDAPLLKKPQPYDFKRLTDISSAMQDMNFMPSIRNAERLLVVVVPEHNAMSGGIYSMFSIATHLRQMKRLHGYEVVVMTRPQRAGLTYFRNTNFINSENVYRFAQLEYCTNLKEVYLLLPEYAAETFLKDLTGGERSLLEGLEKLRINILNQNVRLMPEPEALCGLRELTPDVTQSVAHHSYFSQEEADRYGLPTLLLPAYTDLNAYPSISFDEKEKLIIYSPDDAPHKRRVLAKLSEELPDYELVEICDITFDQFMDLATRCMFSITFGEGFDGYLAQPIHQGGIGFTTFEEEFFPSDHFKDYCNVFDNHAQMLGEICERIRHLSSNRVAYEELNRTWVAEYDKLYNYDEYCERILKLAMCEFELFPNAN